VVRLRATIVTLGVTSAGFRTGSLREPILYWHAPRADPLVVTGVPDPTPQRDAGAQAPDQALTSRSAFALRKRSAMPSCVDLSAFSMTPDDEAPLGFKRANGRLEHLRGSTRVPQTSPSTSPEACRSGSFRPNNTPDIEETIICEETLFALTELVNRHEFFFGICAPGRGAPRVDYQNRPEQGKSRCKWRPRD
jgi:hypothetical protein